MLKAKIIDQKQLLWRQHYLEALAAISALGHRTLLSLNNGVIDTLYDNDYLLVKS